MAAREDVSEGSDAPKTAQRVLRKIETILTGETPERPRALERAEETYQSSSGRREIHDLVDENYHLKSIEEIERNTERAEECSGPTKNALSKSPNPNPRKLG